jgi:hypothetical protein
MFKNFDKNKLLYYGLIITFTILYAATAFVSWYHAITFFNIANAAWLSVILSFVAEIGQASVLFEILSSKKQKFLSWGIMFLLTTLQVIGNVVSSYKYIAESTGSDFLYFQKSILFWVQASDPEMFKVIIAWIVGAILPIIALSMTALVADKLHLKSDGEEENKIEDIIAMPATPAEMKQTEVQDEEVIDSDKLKKEFDRIDNASSLDDAKMNVESEFKEIVPQFTIEIPRELEEGWTRENPALQGIDSAWDNDTLDEFEEPFWKPGQDEKDTLTEQSKPLSQVDIDEMKQDLIEEAEQYSELQQEIKAVEKKTPIKLARGWNLKKKYIDTNGDVYSHGEFVSEAQPEESKKV